MKNTFVQLSEYSVPFMYSRKLHCSTDLFQLDRLPCELKSNNGHETVRIVEIPECEDLLLISPLALATILCD